MIFSSFEFIFLFLPITFIIYFYLNSKRLTGASKSFLVLASLFFYSWWNIIYLPIILVSMLFNYAIGNILNGKNNKNISKKTLLTIGIILNIGLLAYFKYADFFIENLNFIATSQVELLNLALPLAISFFTFQQIAYLVDSYRKETQEYDFLNYALFVTFFPQLIAGPIVHHKEMMPQFASKYKQVKKYKNIAVGIFIFSIGLFKKVVIADTFALFATQGFDNSISLTLVDAWITSLSYTYQLYYDFSGYTDMAIGIALLFNIKLPINFNSPYKATNIQDFWRRWHITLSRFLRDYIYIPLGGNRKGNFKTYSNLMATFILGGIWHGAGWTFIFWGFLHGFALSIHRLWSGLGYKLNIVIAWIITFNFVNISWVFFRAKEWEDAIKVLKGMFGLNGIYLPNALKSIFGDLERFGIGYSAILTKISPNISSFDLYIGLLIAFLSLPLIFMKNSNELANKMKYNYKYILFIVCLLFISFLFMNSTRATEFLYFDF
jgi:alginate O-acetyltransferase complex protein AlgI